MKANYSNSINIIMTLLTNQPVIINITGGVLSEGDPSVKTATQTTSVPLYTGMAGMVRVSTNIPSLSLIEPALISEY